MQNRKRIKNINKIAIPYLTPFINQLRTRCKRHNTIHLDKNRKAL